jgi:hypothetical protein
LTVAIDFIKGHMGGNRIILLDGEQVPAGDELQVALRALEDLSLSGHQVGLLYPPERGGHVRARVVSVCGKDFIPACGGMTQVLGKALVEGGLAERFGIQLDGPAPSVTVEFDAISVPIRVHTDNDRVSRVETDFTSFAMGCLRRGIEPVDLDGTPVLRVGHFFVLNGEEVRRCHPFADFEAMDKPTKELLVRLQWQFLGATALTSWDTTLYDWNPENGGDLRAIYPHNIRIGFIEPSCGTGSIALALGLAVTGEVGEERWRDDELTLVLETGGRNVLGGPDYTTVRLRRQDGRISGASFSNSNLALVARGQLVP